MIERAAKAALEAYEGGAAEKLAGLARGDHPDPWCVADALLATGEVEAARAFAAAAPRPAVASLPKYVAAAPPAASQAEDRAAMEAARLARAGGDAQAAVAALKGRPETKDTVVAVRIHFLRGRALDDLGRYDESAVAYLAAADAAKQLGWGAQESHALYMLGLAHWMRGRSAPIVEAFERRLAVETALGSKAGMGRVHFGLSTTYAVLGARGREAQHLASARALAEEAGDIEYLAKCLANEAGVAARDRDYESALAKGAEALEAFDRIDAAGLATRFQPDPKSVAESRARAQLGRAAWALQLSDIERARTFVGDARATAEAAGHKAVVALCAATGRMIDATWLELDGKDDQAVTHYEEALNLWTQAGDVEKTADTLIRIAAIHGRFGDFLTGLEKVQAALDLLTRFRSATSLMYARLHAGNLNLQLGRTSEAQLQLEEALRTARGLGHLQGQADVLAAMAAVHRHRGEPARAMQCLQEALRLQEESGKPGRRGQYLLAVGSLHAGLGDWGLARATLDRALTELQARRDHYNVRVARSALAGVMRSQGRLDEAYEAFAALSKELEATRSRASRANALVQMALIRFDQKHYQEALGLFGRARELHAAGGAHDAEIHLRVAMAGTRFWLGQREEALADLQGVYESAVAEAESPQVRFDAARMLAEASYRMGKHADAIRWAHAGVEISAGLGLELGEEQGAAFRTRFASIHELGAAAALAAGRTEDLYEFMERGRAATLLAELGGRDALRETTVPAHLRKAEDQARAVLARAQHGYARARRTGAFQATKQARKRLDAAIDGLRVAVTAIQQEARIQADLDYAAVRPLAELAAGLAPDEAMVQYARVLGTMVALVVTREGARPVDLGKVEALDEAVGGLLEGREGPVDSGAKQGVGRLLIDPLKLKGGTKRLLISPDGSLAYVPFSLLSGGRDVVLVPSGTTLGILRTVDVSQADEVLALGDPLYEERPKGAVPPPPIPRGAELTRLEKTGDEVHEIGNEVYVREEASETTFRKVVGREKPWRAVHLACHGLVDPERPTLCALALTPDKWNDGFLTANDVFELRVPAELVVLSACDTGRGKVVRGEGLLGLTRAFMYAGAPRVLASLWKVDDAATKALMSAFYRLWNPKSGSRGVPAATALRMAQEHVSKQPKWKDPRYWAAWVLWGLPD